MDKEEAIRVIETDPNFREINELDLLTKEPVGSIAIKRILAEQKHQACTYYEAIQVIDEEGSKRIIKKLLIVNPDGTVKVHIRNSFPES